MGGNNQALIYVSIEIILYKLLDYKWPKVNKTPGIGCCPFLLLPHIGHNFISVPHFSPFCHMTSKDILTINLWKNQVSTCDQELSVISGQAEFCCCCYASFWIFLFFCGAGVQQSGFSPRSQIYSSFPHHYHLFSNTGHCQSC